MAKSHNSTNIILEPRERSGSTAARALRKEGKIPGVLYGHGSATPIAISERALTELLLSGDKGHVVDAKIGSVKDSVLLRKVETDPVTRKPLSVDFQRVSRDEAVTATVPLHVVGVSKGVRDKAGVLDVVSHTLSIKGPSGALPEHLEVDISELDVHEHINASAVKLPDGFTLITPPDTVVAAVEVPRSQVEATVPSPTDPVPADAAAATPAT